MTNACANIITANPADVILFVFALIVLVVLVGCIWAFFYAVFLFVFSRGDDSKIKSAWNGIRYMIIGLFLTVMVLFMGPMILKVFRVQNPDMYSAKYIFVKVGNIVSCVSTGIVSVITDYPNNNPFGEISDPLGITVGTTRNGNDLSVYEL